MNALKVYFIAIPFSFLMFAWSLKDANAEEACGNEIYQEYLENNPLLKFEFDAVNSKINLSNISQRIQGELLEIPIAVTILHLGEPIGTGTNISDEIIYEAVRGANERWRKISGEGVDMEIQFCLAQNDPQGNPSNGIIRINASNITNYTQYGISYIGALGQPGADETTIKNLNNWPHNYVYNIWVVNKIAGGWGGYAFFPFNGNYATDGTVIIASNMRYSSTTLAHELGHGMGLFHTFQGNGNESICPDNLICSLQGDWVCDTPPHKKNDCATTTCSNSADSILALTFKNYMSYCGGRNLFTAGQKTRSRNTIFNSSRNQLLSSNACYRPCDTVKTFLAVTTCDINVAGMRKDTLITSRGCDSIITTTATLLPEPIADFTFQLNGLEVAFTNQSLHASTYEWDFGDLNTSTELHPIHLYTTPGNYTVQCIATNICSNDTLSETISIITTGVDYNTTNVPISIYPNPNRGSFTIDIDVSDNEQTQLTVINSIGQTIEQQFLSKGKTHQIQLNKNVANGLYLLQIKKNNVIIGIRTFGLQ